MNIGKIKGINIKLHFSTLLIVALVGFYAADLYASLVENIPLWELMLVGLLNGFIILFSILIHELMHSIMAQKYGLKVSEIELYIFGGVSKIEEEPRTPKSEFVISIVGPMISVLFGGILYIFYLVPIPFPAFLSVTFFYSGFTNLLLGAFNLLPAFPMDGGRVLRAYLWKRRGNIVDATRTASKVATYFGYGFMVLGFLETFLLASFSGLWLIFIGIFLNNSAKQAYAQTIQENWLEQLKARDIMGLPAYAIPFNTIVIDALKTYFLPYKRTYFPVIQGPEVVGIIHMDDINKIPYEQRFNIIVGYVMKRITDFESIKEEASGLEAVKRLRKVEHFPQILIVREDDEEKTILGFIGNDDVASAMRFAQMNIHT